MKYSSLKIAVVGLMGLFLANLITPSFIQAAPRDAVGIEAQTISAEHHEFMKNCLSEIAKALEDADRMVHEFISDTNREPHSAHIKQFEALIEQLRIKLIDPLNAKKGQHPFFQVAHDEIMLKLQNMLNKLFNILKSSTNFIKLGLELGKIENDFDALRTQLEQKVTTLTIMVEAIAPQETSYLQQVINRIKQNNPFKGLSKNQILSRLKHRLGC